MFMRVKCAELKISSTSNMVSKANKEVKLINRENITLSVKDQVGVSVLINKGAVERVLRSGYNPELIISQIQYNCGF